MIIVSACLTGVNCKWNGKSKSCQKIMELVKNGKAIPVCPEQLGGLATPRSPSEQREDKVFTKDGIDVTMQFERGAKKALEMAKNNHCNKAILKARSPSCGCGKIYDGTFSGKVVDGDGIFTKILKNNNIEVITEEEYLSLD